jgi:oligopeptide transport system ATP-binding protein
MSGEILFNGKDLLKLTKRELQVHRGKDIAMVFQDPMTALNPVITIGKQMTDILYRHQSSVAEKRARATEMLRLVGIPDAEERLDNYPHEFSGGMRQRIMIAMSLLCQPKLLIADEPTTALDVTVQAQIMQLLGDIRQDFGTAVILITHDLGVVAGFCDRTLVMYGGQIMEEAPTEALFADPSHPYTSGLLQAVPRLDKIDGALATIAGEPPDMSRLPKGCPFSPRCAQVLDNCSAERPALESHANTRRRACHLPASEVAK